MIISEPMDILVNYLRSIVSEVTRTGSSNRQTNATQSFNGNGVLLSFTLTNVPQCINSVTVGGTVQKMFVDYNFDLDNKLVVFVAGSVPPVGTNNVVVDYDHGSAWIDPFNSKRDLTKDSYPRIVVTPINENGKPTGTSETDTYDSLVFQIDVVTYKDQMCTISSEQKEGPDVLQYISRQVVKHVIEDRAMIDAKLWNPELFGNFPMPYQNDKNIYHQVIEFKFEAPNAGR